MWHVRSRDVCRRFRAALQAASRVSPEPHDLVLMSTCKLSIHCHGTPGARASPSQPPAVRCKSSANNAVRALQLCSVRSRHARREDAGMLMQDKAQQTEEADVAITGLEQESHCTAVTAGQKGVLHTSSSVQRSGLLDCAARQPWLVPLIARLRLQMRRCSSRCRYLWMRHRHFRRLRHSQQLTCSGRRQPHRPTAMPDCSRRRARN